MKSLQYVIACLWIGFFAGSWSGFAYANDVSSGALNREYSNPKAVVVLVPGLFNSLVPDGPAALNPRSPSRDPYFSADIRNVLISMGYDIFITRNLHWAGGIESNGNEAYREVLAWYSKKYPHGGVPIYLLGHSSGGLYALQMAHVNRALPVQKIIMVSTPLNGARLADRLIDTSILVSYLVNEFVAMVPFVDLSGFTEVTSQRVRTFISHIQIPSSVHLTVAGGGQDWPSSPLNAWNSYYLLPGLVMSSEIMGVYSDGIVDYDSAMGTRLNLQSRDRTPISIKRLTNLNIALDHFEQAIDYRLLAVLGNRNLDYIRRQQVSFYKQLMNSLN